MKKLLTIISITALLSVGCDSKKDSRVDEKNKISANEVPAPVKDAFTAKYPNASDVVWEDAHEGDMNTYKVKFKTDGKDWKAEFGTNGQLVKEKED
jgi:hypothetical protein